ncbi:MAG TPA: efflux RND transporter periplasmic adaptor subunit [Patescibacteria group bacterium]|nr:efflux RND transporter periplasmic adaptor subunit [Patescibacteria group bacterium]
MKNLIGKIRKPENLRKLAAVILVVLIVGAYMFFQKSRDRVQIDDSLISAPTISISPSSGGKLTSLPAVEGHYVKAGDTLAVVGSETIRAQTDGLIISANNQVGGNVAPSAPIIQMIKTTDMRIAGTIDENKGLDDIKIGQVVSFTVDALPGKTFWGYVDEISPTAKQTQAAFSISSERPTQQFQVYARFDSSAYPQIKNGMSAKMTVYLNN